MTICEECREPAEVSTTTVLILKQQVVKLEQGLKKQLQGQKTSKESQLSTSPTRRHRTDSSEEVALPLMSLDPNGVVGMVRTCKVKDNSCNREIASSNQLLPRMTDLTWGVHWAVTTCGDCPEQAVHLEVEVAHRLLLQMRRHKMAAEQQMV